LRERVDDGVLEVGRLGAGDEVHEDLGIAHGVEDRAVGLEPLPQFRAVDEVAVVRDGNHPLVRGGHQRLGVAQHRAASGRIADVADGRIAR
jgi:hypothetical protein